MYEPIATDPKNPHPRRFFLRRNGSLLATACLLLAMAQVNCRYWQQPSPEPEPQAQPLAPVEPAQPTPPDMPWARRPIAPTAAAPALLPAPPVVRVRVGPDRSVATISTTGPCRILVDGNVVLTATEALKPTPVSRREGLWRVGASAHPGAVLTLLPAADSTFRLDKTLYRGHLTLHPLAASSFFAVNHVDLESYLAGVLARELLKDWHGETYRTLSIAARTYAWFEASANQKDGPFDVWDSVMSQVYGGASGETPLSRAAAASTRGLVLMTQREGRPRVFRAYYCSCCGGRTNSAEVLRAEPPAAPLRGGVTCDDCRIATHYRWSPVRLSKRELYTALVAAFPSVRSLGTLSSVRVHSASAAGRPLWLDLVGPRGKSVRLLADDLRIAAIRGHVSGADRLYSMNCRLADSPATVDFLDGRGFGHGVGLCQWGAQGKALAGWPAERILLNYYPSSEIVRLY